MRKKIRIAACAALAALLLASVCAPAAAGAQSMANFEKIRTYADPYADVGASTPAWALSAVKTCYETGLMQGADGCFNGGDRLTAAQAVVMADRVHQIFNTGKSTLENGVPWYQPYVDYAVENGIVGKDEFADYAANITRAEMALIFSRALPAEMFTKIKTVYVIPDLDDAPARSRDAVRLLYSAGILTGSDAYGAFLPNNEITRYEAAAIIARVAIPSERRTDALFYKVTDGPVTFALPQTGELTTTSASEADGSVSCVYSSENSGLRVCLSVSTDAVFEGADLTALYDADAFKALISEDPASDFRVAAVLPVTFGPINAYRASGRLGGGETRLEYWFVDGQSMYCLSATWTDEADRTALQKTLDSMTVGGSAAGVRCVV